MILLEEEEKKKKGLGTGAKLALGALGVAGALGGAYLGAKHGYMGDAAQNFVDHGSTDPVPAPNVPETPTPETKEPSTLDKTIAAANENKGKLAAGAAVTGVAALDYGATKGHFGAKAQDIAHKVNALPGQAYDAGKTYAGKGLEMSKDLGSKGMTLGKDIGSKAGNAIMGVLKRFRH